MNIKKVDINKVKEYIAQMYSKKPLYSNYYNQSLTSDDCFYKTTDTLLIVKRLETYNRIYILSDSLEDAAESLNNLKGINVVNIPSKGNIVQWEKLMNKSDFKLTGIYERFYNTSILPQEEIGKITYADPVQIEEIYGLFYDSGFFSVYTDYLPLYDELKKLIEQKNVIVNLVGKVIQGAFIFSIEGLKCYFRAWIDKSNTPLKLLFDIYNIMVNNKLNYSYFGVNSENKKVKSIHRFLGAKPDGLKDYTFIKYESKTADS